MKHFLIAIAIFASIQPFTLKCMQQPLQPWVQAANSIQVRTLLQKSLGDIGITNNSTILDVKNSVRARQGIPTEQQKLYAEYKQRFDNGRGWYLKDVRSEELSDYENAKEIMNRYNSKCFLLFLTLRRERPDKG